jgi:hypothetical protein
MLTYTTGLPVDAVILPASPHAGVIPGKYYHYCKLSSWLLMREVDNSDSV